MSLPHKRPYKLSFKNPLTGTTETGDLLDEICRPEPDLSKDEFGGGTEALFVAQLVQWGENKRIRICYYTRKPGLKSEGWRFSMNPPSMAPEECQKLFEQMQAKGWFLPDLNDL